MREAQEEFARSFAEFVTNPKTRRHLAVQWIVERRAITAKA